MAARFRVRPLLGKPQRLLAVNDWRLGDEIMAIPLYASVKRKFPGCRLTVKCNYPELLSENPSVDSTDPGDGVFDRLVDLKFGEPSILRIQGLAQRHRLPQPESRPHVIVPEKWRTAARQRFQTDGSPCIVLSGGATWACKQWPPSHNRDLVQALKRRHGATVLHVGRDCTPVEGTRSLIGQTTVQEAAALVADAGLFIGTDSGLLHLALSVGTRSVGLFGPVDPGTLIKPCPVFVPIVSPVQCRFCWSEGRMHEPGECPLGKPVCMEAIQVSAVLEAAGTLLSGDITR